MDVDNQLIHQKSIMITVIILFFLLMLGIMYFIIKQNKVSCPKKINVSKEEYEYSKDFYMYNYLTANVQVDAILEEGKKVVTLAKNIRPKTRFGITIQKVWKHIRRGNKLRFYVFDELRPGIPKLHYADYDMTMPDDSTIKALHIGMVSSKVVGATQDTGLITGWSAVQGRPWIKIHNHTLLPINLNRNITISPGGLLRYSGREHTGVKLGTIFKDTSFDSDPTSQALSIYPPFEYNVPATDIYYGIVSDIQQPLFGEWQIDQDFDDEPDHPIYLYENGWIGGPGRGNIDPAFIPKEGSEVPLKDRWGNLLEEQKKNDDNDFTITY